MVVGEHIHDTISAKIQTPKPKKLLTILVTVIKGIFKLDYLSQKQMLPETLRNSFRMDG
jgi:hypothetical protein